jgi:hypothetical protein
LALGVGIVGSRLGVGHVSRPLALAHGRGIRKQRAFGVGVSRFILRDGEAMHPYRTARLIELQEENLK